jgi:hypothetical protein
MQARFARALAMARPPRHYYLTVDNPASRAGDNAAAVSTKARTGIGSSIRSVP